MAVGLCVLLAISFASGFLFSYVAKPETNGEVFVVGFLIGFTCIPLIPLNGIMSILVGYFIWSYGGATNLAALLGALTAWKMTPK